MTTKRCGSAPHDGSDHFELLKPEVMCVDEVVGLSTENVGHLEGGPAHRFTRLLECFTAFVSVTLIASSGLVTAWR